MSELSRAMQCEEEGNLEGARAAYHRAMADGESHGGAGLRLLGVLLRLGAFEELLELADELDGKRPRDGRAIVVDSAAIAVQRTRALLFLQRDAEALAAGRDAVARIERAGGTVAGPLAMHPAEAYLALAQALRRVGQPGEAMTITAKAIELDPEWGDAWSELAWERCDAGDVRGALAAVTRAIELDPDDGDPHYNQACYLAMLGESRRALQALTRAIELDPSNAQLARDDADFANLRGERGFRSLVGA